VVHLLTPNSFLSWFLWTFVEDNVEDSSLLPLTLEQLLIVLLSTLPPHAFMLKLEQTMSPIQHSVNTEMPLLSSCTPATTIPISNSMQPLSLLHLHSLSITSTFELLPWRLILQIYLQQILLFMLLDGVTLKQVDQTLMLLCCSSISLMQALQVAIPLTTDPSSKVIKFVPEDLPEKILVKETVVDLSSPLSTQLIPLMPKSSELFHSDLKIARLLELLEFTQMFPDLQMPSSKELSHNLPQYLPHLLLPHQCFHHLLVLHLLPYHQ